MSMIYRNIDDVAGLVLALRKESDISRAKLAKHIGSHGQYVYKIESGKQKPSLDFLGRFVKLPGVKRVIVAVELEEEPNESIDSI